MNRTFYDSFADGIRPDKALDLDDWSDANVVLSTANAAEPGKYRTSRTPYAREILKMLSASSPVQEVILQMGAQVSKTQVGLNFIGGVIDQTPGPILLVEPTDGIAKKVSTQRLGQIITDCDALRKKVVDDKAKDGTNTFFTKTFAGGVLYLTGANSAAGLRSMPVKYLFLDEVDAYPHDLEGEGSPIELAKKRTATFSRKKILIASTPTIKGHSAIETAYLNTDQRRYFVPCPYCNHYDILTWDRIYWEENDPSTAACRCNKCSKLIPEGLKSTMLAKGEWRATATTTDKTAVGYHLSALYSPFAGSSWEACVKDFLAAKNNPEKLKVFTNTVLAETWEERGEQLESHELKARLEEFTDEVPEGVITLIGACDVQDTWLESIVIGFGRNEEAWLIAHTQIPGSPDKVETWNELTAFRRQDFIGKDGKKFKLDTFAIDSGGHFTDKVYKYCKTFQNEGVYAIKGKQEPGRALVSRPTDNNAYRAKLFTIGVDAAKEAIYERLKIKHAGAGYIHLPDFLDDEFLAQITAEKAIRKYIKGRGSVRQWVKTRERNEALDLLVYALAALYLRGPRWVQNRLGSQKLVRKLEAEAKIPDGNSNNLDSAEIDTPANPDELAENSPPKSPFKAENATLDKPKSPYALPEKQKVKLKNVAKGTNWATNF